MERLVRALRGRSRSRKIGMMLVALLSPAIIVTAGAIRVGDVISSAKDRTFKTQAFKTKALDVRMFTPPAGTKAHSCFRSDDDADHFTWHPQRPDDDTRDTLMLMAGDDDSIFRLDRDDTRSCATLLTDRKDFAAIRHE
jgi:hypothetical protein